MKHTPTPIWVYENSKGCRFCGHKLHASEKLDKATELLKHISKVDTDRKGWSGWDTEERLDLILSWIDEAKATLKELEA